MVCVVCQFAICTHHGMAWHAGQTCEEYDSDIEEALAEARRQQEALQERTKAKEREARRQKEIAAEAARQKAARQKALADAEALKRKHAMDNKASYAVVKGMSKTCPNKKCGAQIQKIAGCDHMTSRYLSPFRYSADCQ